MKLRRKPHGMEATIAEFLAAVDNGFCGNRSSDLPLSHPFPPAVCLLPAGHDGMHANGHCRWGHDASFVGGTTETDT